MRGRFKGIAAAVVVALLGTPAAACAYFDVAKLPPPPVTGKEIADNIAAFSTTYAQRITGTPAETAAAAFLRDEATKLGYETKIVNFPLLGVEPFGLIHAVVAERRGTTKPDESIVFGAHYDTVPQTINGSYDNGSGTNMLRALAKSFAAAPTNRTLVFAWYNGEEEGTFASGPHADLFAADKRAVRAMLGFDMVGIGYPVAAPSDVTCLCMWRGEDDDSFDALLQHVNFEVLGFPDKPGLVQVMGLNTRNSDEASWDNAGYPTLRWAGMVTASDYPAYHRPDDTMATIDAVAGGRDFFEQGLRNTLLSSYLTALTLDNEPPVAAASARGSGPVTFDAAGSTDPDTPPASFAWDFGDGKRASGRTVSHAYRKRGRYTVRLTVADNLWPQVTSTATVAVRVKKVAKPKKKRRRS